MQAPHMLVLVFARGLLRHLLTRVYFEKRARQYDRHGAAANSSRASSHPHCSTRQSSDEFVPMGRPSAGPG